MGSSPMEAGLRILDTYHDTIYREKNERYAIYMIPLLQPWYAHKHIRYTSTFTFSIYLWNTNNHEVDARTWMISYSHLFDRSNHVGDCHAWVLEGVTYVPRCCLQYIITSLMTNAIKISCFMLCFCQRYLRLINRLDLINKKTHKKPDRCWKRIQKGQPFQMFLVFSKRSLVSDHNVLNSRVSLIKMND